jgi:hypothetical protein
VLAWGERRHCTWTANPVSRSGDRKLLKKSGNGQAKPHSRLVRDLAGSAGIAVVSGSAGPTKVEDVGANRSDWCRFSRRSLRLPLAPAGLSGDPEGHERARTCGRFRRSCLPAGPPGLSPGFAPYCASRSGPRSWCLLASCGPFRPLLPPRGPFQIDTARVPGVSADTLPGRSRRPGGGLCR